MTILEMNNIQKYIKERLLFKLEGRITISKNDRIGIVGLNGAGKSTFLSVLAGKAELDAGTISHKINMIEISQNEEASISVEFSCNLSKWGIGKEMHAGMSGGEKMRMKIAEALDRPFDLLLADEPTSHLDLSGITKLEQEIKNVQGAVIIVSHDRAFLDAVCTKMIEIDNERMIEYQGNYSAYLEQKEVHLNRAQFEYDEYTREKSRLQQAFKEKQSKAKTMKKKPKRMSYKEANLGAEKARSKQAKVNRSAKTIEKRIEQLEKKEKPIQKDQAIFDASQHKRIHNKFVIKMELVNKQMVDRTLFKDLNVMIKPGMKVALIGNNGIGKSTLLRMIAKQEVGISVSGICKIGYLHQTLNDLNQGQSILENVLETSTYSQEKVRTILARMLFKRDEVHKKVSVLSGGERVKVALAKCFVSDANLLLLDEPTNYLDIPTQESLQKVLKEYPGTILFATHDRRLINQLATYTLLIENEKGLLHEGNYDALLKRRQERQTKESSFIDSNEEELLKIEHELSEVIGKLGYITDLSVKQDLENRYESLLKQKRELKVT
ncbi:ribosomal protection-like ABC-F family protein [Chengkuizengella axinellae]|uniref:ABC-F type ribosomal protection protein n=1 Tax=Chengkuizengella axinellae TaxID=3064388 RepID=A0ABT9J160_9BACL|nr:ABC-F type ribosomal protection protein [Chengkuizengella sp. 2205SS18-9]MDP5275350.1 ABC-F type ribosomal protection protein [Chengkuizengella sp. 2205SS18-9]